MPSVVITDYTFPDLDIELGVQSALFAGRKDVVRTDDGAQFRQRLPQVPEASFAVCPRPQLQRDLLPEG